MRVLLIATLILATGQMAAAKPLTNGNDCFVRSYSKAHLASHPDQLVRYISLSPVPLQAPAGQVLMNLTVNQSGSDYYYSSFVYCREKAAGLACAMEGDAGRFNLEGRTKGQLLLTVGRDGLVFEGSGAMITISGTAGDDRSFLLAPQPSSACN